ncbi:hypothetical protein Hanom_Chr07g00664591 [Helianthus anomalus]
MLMLYSKNYLLTIFSVMVPIIFSTSLQSSSNKTLGFHITIHYFNGSTYIHGFTFLTVFIYIFFLFN